MRWITISLVFSFCVITGYGQGYKINFHIDGLTDKQLFLGYYLNGKTYIQDTADYLGQDAYVFQGEQALKKGIYFISRGKTLMFDLVIAENQRFKLETTEENYLDSMKVIGDQENELFFKNMTFNFERSKEAAPLLEILKDTTATEDQKRAARKEMGAINSKVVAFQEEIIGKYPESTMSTLFQMNKRPQIPQELTNDKEKSLHYYRTRYWDFFDLGNPVLFRVPNAIYKQKVDDYMDNLIFPKPDSVIVAIDQLIDRAKKNEDTYQTLVWHLTIKYQTSKVLGFDEVYVYLVDNYFLTGEMDFWANDQLKKNLKEKADQYRSSLIGLVAPNLVLQDLKKQPKALHDLPNKYAVIYFYDPDCGHCKKETPVLKEFYSSTSFDVGVYTVSADTSMTKMSEYIDEMGLESWTNTNGTKTYGLNYQEVYDAYTTPTIYLLNAKKEIIAKKIKASQLEEVLTHYEKNAN